jgi:hypothetical protein
LLPLSIAAPENTALFSIAAKNVANVISSIDHAATGTAPNVSITKPANGLKRNLKGVCLSSTTC